MKHLKPLSGDELLKAAESEPTSPEGMAVGGFLMDNGLLPISRARCKWCNDEPVCYCGDMIKGHGYDGSPSPTEDVCPYCRECPGLIRTEIGDTAMTTGTITATILSPNAPTHAALGVKPVNFVALEKGESWESIVKRFLSLAKTTDSFNFEIGDGKELPDGTHYLENKPWSMAKALRAAGFRGGLYGPARTEWYPGETEPPEDLSDMETIARAYSPYVTIVDADAWPIVDPATITHAPGDSSTVSAVKNVAANAAWQRYQRGIVIARQRHRLMWKDAQGQSLPIRWTLGTVNVYSKPLPSWWNKQAAALFRRLVAAGDSVRLQLGWVDGVGRVPWTAEDAAICAALKVK